MNGAPDATIVPAVSSPTGTLTSNGIQLTEWSRIYLSDSCGPLPSSYSAWTLLGRTVSFTVDLSAAGCGCNIAFYLVSMRTNAQEGTCSGGNSGAYYCDANSVCGVRCDELDLMEANSRAFHSVAHHLNDGSGQGMALVVTICRPCRDTAQAALSLIPIHRFESAPPSVARARHSTHGRHC